MELSKANHLLIIGAGDKDLFKNSPYQKLRDLEVSVLGWAHLNESTETMTHAQFIVIYLDDFNHQATLDEWSLQAWRATLNELVVKCTGVQKSSPRVLGVCANPNWDAARLGVKLGVRDLLLKTELDSRLLFYLDGKTPSEAPVVQNVLESGILKFEPKNQAPSIPNDIEPHASSSGPVPRHLIPFPIEGLEGSSSAVEALRSLVRKTSSLDTPILLVGSTGTGKELVAQTLHKYSPRASHAFVAVNCGAVSPQLFESEFFGHVAGAFTNAIKDSDGYFRQAQGGTLFLDEISELPLENQAKLLRALQEKEVRPVGAAAAVPFDVRIIAATKINLRELVEAKLFREDLYYRLKVIEIELPSLSERRADIPEISQSLIKKLARRHRHPILELSEAALEKFLHYSWNGNIRELENVLERAATLCWAEQRLKIEISDLPDNVQFATMNSGTATDDLKKIVHRFEREYIASTIRRLGGSKEEAAEVLGLSLATLYRKLA